MKKIIPIVFILAVFFSGCTKWNQPDPSMTPELKQKTEDVITKNLETLKETPEELTALLDVAVSYEKLGKYKEAVEYYEKIIELSPFNYPALNNISYVYEQVGEYDMAAKYIKILYEQNQTNPEVMRDTVRILLEAGEPDSAQTALENFAKLYREAGDSSEQVLISELYGSINSYNQEKEKSSK